MQLLPKVLLVEDDRSIAAALAHALQSSHDIDVAGSGRLAMHKTKTETFDVIMLDLCLPDMSGIIICQQLRDRGVSAPILILTAASDIMTKITLLDAGANDYLTKPFSLGELKARLRALVRNAGKPARRENQLSISGVVLSRRTHKVSRNGIAVVLRRKEFALLECLMEHAGTVVSRSTLIRHAWEDSDNLWTNSVDVHIKYLRDKLDRPFGHSLITTVHGLGYKIEALGVFAPEEVR